MLHGTSWKSNLRDGLDVQFGRLIPQFFSSGSVAVVLFRSDVPHLKSLVGHELMIDEHSSYGQVLAYHLRHKYGEDE